MQHLLNWIKKNAYIPSNAQTGECEQETLEWKETLVLANCS